MTRDEILAMEPGRELDAIVAENVIKFELEEGRGMLEKISPEFAKFMGYPVEEYEKPNLVIKWENSIGGQKEIPNYSSDISAAWEVVEHFKSKGYLFSLKNLVGGKYEFSLTDWGGMCSIYTGQGDTPSSAIVKAALLTTLREDG